MAGAAEQEADGNQHGLFDAADIQNEGQRNQNHVEQHQLPKSRFAGEGCAQAVQRITGSVEDAFQAGLALER